MSGKRVLAVYAALLLGFAVVLCRLYLLALHPAYAARAAAQSTVTLQLPARRGNFYDAQGQLLTGLEKRWQVVCFPGQGNYDRLYACTDAAGQALLYRSRSRAAPFLLEVSCDPARLGLTGYPAARRYAAVPLCQHLLGYLDGTDHGAAGLEKALDAVLSGTGEHSSLVCAVTAQGTLRTGETARLLQADSGALGVQLTISRPVQRAVEAVAASTMTSGCILVLDTATAAVRASVSVPCYDPENLADSLQAENSPFPKPGATKLRGGLGVQAGAGCGCAGSGLAAGFRVHRRGGSGWADLSLRGRGAAWTGGPCRRAGKKLQRLFYPSGTAAGCGKLAGRR